MEGLRLLDEAQRDAAEGRVAESELRAKMSCSTADAMADARDV